MLSFSLKMRWWLSAGLLLLIAPVHAQQAKPAVRPRIAIVLEGGSARGFAHIGVLKWFEENHIPVDYVVGTSMGALVGGMYATGMAPEEIRGLVNGLDWNQILRGETKYQDLTFRRKEDSRAFPNGLEFGLRNGVRFPSGFNSGHWVSLILDRAALPYSNLKSFDDLPIPFRCVGSDLVTGKVHVFKDGSVAEAMRASMSLPGFFTPVRAQGTAYVDGGVLNNLPIDVAKQLKPDIIVAVHLRVAPLDPKQPLSSVEVLGQSMSVAISANELRNMELADILITVDLTRYAAADFDKADEISKQGYAAAQSKSNVLTRISVDEESWREYLADRNARRILQPPAPHFVEVAGGPEDLARTLEKKLAPHIGRPVNTAALESDLNRIAGLGRYTNVDYQMVERDSQSGLRIIAHEKEYAPPLVRPLLIVDGADYSNVRFGAGARITLLDVGGFGSEWRNDFLLGANNFASSEFYKPFRGLRGWFVAIRAFARSQTVDLYSRGSRLAEYRVRRGGGGMDVGYAFGRFSELRLGYEASRGSSAIRIGAPTLPTLSGRAGISSIHYRLDRLDDPIVPRQGVYLGTKLQWFDANPGSTRGFPVFEGDAGWFHKLGEPSSIFLLASGGSTFDRANTGVPLFWLGGPRHWAAHGSNEILTNQYYLFRLGYLREVFRIPPPFGGSVFLTGYYEAGHAFQAPNISALPNDFTTGVIAKTIVGPLFVGGSFGDTGHRKFFFLLGRIF